MASRWPLGALGRRGAAVLLPPLLALLVGVPLALYLAGGGPRCPAKAADGPAAAAAVAGDVEVPWGEDPLAQSRQCGTWQAEYANLHRDTLAGGAGAGAGFLVYYCGSDTGVPRPCGGVGDELVGMVSSLLLAVLTRRALLVYNPQMDGLFEPVAVDWRWAELPRSMKPSTAGWINARKWRPTVLDDGRVGVANVLNFGRRKKAQHLHDIFDFLKERQFIVLRINRGVTSKLLREASPWQQQMHALGLLLPTAFACLTRFLLRCTPQKCLVLSTPVLEMHKHSPPYSGYASADFDMKETVKEARLVSPELLAPQQHIIQELADSATFSIGIHIRAGFRNETGHALQFSLPADADKDTAAVRKLALREYFQDLFDCAQRLEDFWASPNLRLRWYVMSDSWDMKQAAKDIWGSKTSRGMQDVGVEWELFSRCQYFIFIDSGLSKSAAAKALQPHNLYRLIELVAHADDAAWSRTMQPEGALSKSEHIPAKEQPVDKQVPHQIVYRNYPLMAGPHAKCENPSVSAGSPYQ
eukprot:SM000107S14027  [mRNA]  locus=s107:7683:12889:+ [translate_table: standard]